MTIHLEPQKEVCSKAKKISSKKMDSIFSNAGHNGHAIHFVLLFAHLFAVHSEKSFHRFLLLLFTHMFFIFSECWSVVRPLRHIFIYAIFFSRFLCIFIILPRYNRFVGYRMLNGIYTYFFLCLFASQW